MTRRPPTAALENKASRRPTSRRPSPKRKSPARHSATSRAPRASRAAAATYSRSLSRGRRIATPLAAGMVAHRLGRLIVRMLTDGRLSSRDRFEGSLFQTFSSSTAHSSAIGCRPLKRARSIRMRREAIDWPIGEVKTGPELTVGLLLSSPRRSQRPRGRETRAGRERGAEREAPAAGAWQRRRHESARTPSASGARVEVKLGRTTGAGGARDCSWRADRGPGARGSSALFRVAFKSTHVARNGARARVARFDF